MTVQTKEVDILAKTISNLFVELDAVEMSTFFGTTSINMIDIDHCDISKRKKS